jgi:hypothetical protein
MSIYLVKCKYFRCTVQQQLTYKTIWANCCESLQLMLLLLLHWYTTAAEFETSSKHSLHLSSCYYDIFFFFCSYWYSLLLILLLNQPTLQPICEDLRPQDVQPRTQDRHERNRYVLRESVRGSVRARARTHVPRRRQWLQNGNQISSLNLCFLNCNYNSH